MKEDLFWKVLAIIFICWLFLWLWNSSIQIEGRLKINKITGNAYVLRDGEWKKL
jgi:hypothetical protein